MFLFSTCSVTSGYEAFCSNDMIMDYGFIIITYLLFMLHCREHLGENIIYLWVEKVREFLHEELKNISGEIASAGDVNESERHKSKVRESRGSSAALVSPSFFSAVGDPVSSELIDHFSNTLHF